VLIGVVAIPEIVISPFSGQPRSVMLAITPFREPLARTQPHRRTTTAARLALCHDSVEFTGGDSHSDSDVGLDGLLRLLCAG